MLYFYKILNSVIHNLGDINFESHLKLHRISERKFPWRVAGGGTMIVRTVLTEGSHEHSECLQDRKWWCFLLSSILSFIVGVFSVLFIRACAAVFCRRAEEYSQTDCKKQLEEEKRHRQQETGSEREVRLRVTCFQLIFQCQGGDFMSEAKDWAGELISGQTGTGRILVNLQELKVAEFKTISEWQVCLVFILSISSLIIYFIDASR